MILKIKVIPNARKNEIHKMNESHNINELQHHKSSERTSKHRKPIDRPHHFSHLKVHLKASPEKGKANQELISMLADHFNIHENKIRIIRGHASHDKIVEIIK